MNAKPPPIDLDIIGVEPDEPDPAGRPDGEERRRWLLWSASFTLAALVIGAVVGYQLSAHDRGDVKPAVRSSAAATETVTTAAPLGSAVDPRLVLQLTGNRCSAQVGQTLQLGVEVRNTGAEPVVLQSVRPVALGGTSLTPQLSSRGTCGQQAQGSPANFALGAGDAVWLRGTFAVNISCPSAIPVQFTVTFARAGLQTTVQLQGFNDLGDVPYSGCPAS